MEKKAAINNEGSDLSFENLFTIYSKHRDQLTHCTREAIDELKEGRAAAAEAEELDVHVARTKLLPSLLSLSDELNWLDSDDVQNLLDYTSRGKEFGDVRKVQCIIQEIVAKLLEVEPAIGGMRANDEAATAEGMLCTNIDAGETAGNIVTYAAIHVKVNDNTSTAPAIDADAESTRTTSLLIADAAQGSLLVGEPQSTTPQIGIKSEGESERTAQPAQQNPPAPQTTTANTRTSTQSFVSSPTVLSSSKLPHNQSESTDRVEIPMSGTGELSKSCDLQVSPQSNLSRRNPSTGTFTGRIFESPESKASNAHAKSTSTTSLLIADAAQGSLSIGEPQSTTLQIGIESESERTAQSHTEDIADSLRVLHVVAFPSLGGDEINSTKSTFFNEAASILENHHGTGTHQEASESDSSQDPSSAPTEEQEFRHATKRKRATGLRNLGNSCFMNSTLQCLAHTVPLRDYFLSGKYKADLKKDNSLGTGGKLALEFASLLCQMWSDSGSGLDSVTDPTCFKESLGSFATQFMGNDQQDSQELCIYLLNILHEDTNRVREKPPYAERPEQEEGESDEVTANKARNFDLQRDDSRVVEIFKGQYKSRVQCPVSGCGRISTTFDLDMYFTVPLPELHSADATLSLMDCITKFGETEQFGENDKWYCNRCNEHVQAWKTIHLYRAPPILFIHLKRFHVSPTTSRMQKLNTLVDFPLNGLDLRGMSTHCDDGKEPIYDLYAVSNHFGQVENGHYTAYAKGDDGTWCKFDDHVVTSVVDESKIVSSAAYCLYYKRKDVTFNCNKAIDDMDRGMALAPASEKNLSTSDRNHDMGMDICGESSCCKSN